MTPPEGATAPPTPSTRVLFVSHEPELVGGAERSLVELVAGLRDDPTIECLVAARRRAGVLDRAAESGATVLVAPTPTWVVADTYSPHIPLESGAGALAAVLRAVPGWVARLRRLRPDTVVTSTSLTPSAAIAARLLGIDHLWWVTEVLRQHPDRRYVLGPERTATTIDRLSRRLIVSSAAVADSLVGVPRTRMRVIAPSCSLTPAPAPPDRTDPSQPLRLLLLARFEPGKGAETAIAAVHRARQAGADVELRLVGPAHPRYRRRLERQGSQTRSRDHITWGEPTDDPTGELDRCDVALVPTTIDAYGRVTAEAMRRGRPVVGAAAAGTLEIVEDGVNGVLFPPDDVTGLAETIARLAADRAEVARLAAGAWTTGQSDFAPERRVALFRAALRER